MSIKMRDDNTNLESMDRRQNHEAEYMQVYVIVFIVG